MRRNNHKLGNFKSLGSKTFSLVPSTDTTGRPGRTRKDVLNHFSNFKYYSKNCGKKSRVGSLSRV